MDHPRRGGRPAQPGVARFAPRHPLRHRAGVPDRRPRPPKPRRHGRAFRRCGARERPRPRGLVPHAAAEVVAGLRRARCGIPPRAGGSAHRGPRRPGEAALGIRGIRTPGCHLLQGSAPGEVLAGHERTVVAARPIRPPNRPRTLARARGDQPAARHRPGASIAQPSFIGYRARRT